jgi:plastocyanin domain-containing protein
MTDDKIRCELCDREFASQEAIDAHNKSKHHTIHREKRNKFPTIIISVTAIIILIIIGFVIFSTTVNKPINTNNTSSSGNVQTATLSVSGSKYILEPSVFKKDVPVQLTADVSSMPGCSKSVTIPTFGVLKYVTPNDNTITFTPTKVGTFRIACSMSMYIGSFTVTE